MDEKQKINCTVQSCIYNDNDEQKCVLEEITVEPCNEYTTGVAEDESMCGSYEAEYEDDDEE